MTDIIYLPGTVDNTSDNQDYITKQQENKKEKQQTLVPLEEQKEPPQKKKRKTYPQDWTNYNIIQTTEKAMCYKLLHGLIESLDIKQPTVNGRPSVDIKEIIKCLCVKVYNNCSSRRIHSELILFRGLGYIDKIYHFNTLCKYLSDPRVTPILAEMAKALAVPLKTIESRFAADATGFSALDKRWSKVRLDFRQHKDYKKLHIICGIKTNVIASVRVTGGKRADSPYFKPMLDDTVKIFKVDEISADAGYLSRDNCTAAEDVGAKPFIMPKKNTKSISKGSSAWAKMVRMWKDNEEEFRKHYHPRSNVESTFSMIKRKFGGCLRGKLDTTKENEIMCKVVCHNLAVLSGAMIQFGINPKF